MGDEGWERVDRAARPRSRSRGRDADPRGTRTVGFRGFDGPRGRSQPREAYDRGGGREVNFRAPPSGGAGAGYGARPRSTSGGGGGWREPYRRPEASDERRPRGREVERRRDYPEGPSLSYGAPAERDRPRDGETWRGAPEGEAGPRWTEVLAWGLPTTWTFRNVLAFAQKEGGPVAPVAARLLRNAATHAPLGCAVLTCRAEGDARALARRLDGAVMGRGRVSARADLKALAASTLAVKGVDFRKTSPRSLRTFLEQVGELGSFEIPRRDSPEELDGVGALVTYAEGFGAAAALAALDGAVLDGAALRIAPADDRAREPRESARRERSPAAPTRILSRDGPPRNLSPPPPVEAQESSNTITSISDSSTTWEAPVTLRWCAEVAKGQPAPAGSEAAAAPERPAAAEPHAARLVRRAVAFQVDHATSFLAAQPARAVAAATAAAPPSVDVDAAAFAALLPQRFTLGATEWRAGLWPDASALWEMLKSTRLVDPACEGEGPPPRHVALALGMVDGDGEDPAALRAAQDTVTVAIVAALRPADPAVSLSRSPLDPAALMRNDGRDASAHEPLVLKRYAGGSGKRDILLCLFDRRLAVKRPYLHRDAMRPELILTLLDVATPEAEADAEVEAAPARPAEAGGEDRSSRYAPNALGASLLDLLKRAIGADVVIRTADGVELKAHASILAARCGFFRRHFRASAGRRFDFNAEDAPTLRGLLCFAYGDCLVAPHTALLDDPAAIRKLLDAGRRLDVGGLAAYVEAYVEDNLGLGNLAKTLDALGPVTHAPTHIPKTREERRLYNAPLVDLTAARATAKALATDYAAEPEVAAHLLSARPRDPALRAMLEARLATAVTPANVASLLTLATTVDSEPLRAACMAFARKNLSQVMSDPQFAALLQARSDLVFELLTALDDTAQGAPPPPPKKK